MKNLLVLLLLVAVLIPPGCVTRDVPTTLPTPVQTAANPPWGRSSGNGGVHRATEQMRFPISLP